MPTSNCTYGLRELLVKVLKRNTKRIDQSSGDEISEMASVTKEDRISSLPWDVLDGILVRLPLKEVVRTSILSSRWRRKWTGISQFVIDDKCISSRISDKVARWESIMEILRQVQLHHTGPIEKFKLAAYCRPDHSDLDQWIHYLTDKGLKEFILQEFDTIKRFNLPFCLFSCPLLNRLELFGCRIKPSSEAIGFKSLTNLHLNEVCVTGGTLECLVLNSPVLERLTLLNIDHQIVLRIGNANLKYLKVDSNFDDIYLENSPSLASVDIGLRVRVIPRSFGSEGGNLIRFLGNIDVPDKLPTLLPHLSVLELKDVRLDSLIEVLVCVCIFRSAPNLEELHLSVADTTEYSRPAADFLITKLSNHYFEQLKVAKIRAVQNVQNETIFIQLLLAHSPVLKRMTIVHYGSRILPTEVLEQSVPASKDVEIFNLSV
ncbi:F-box/FBD/LRR-repeat protein [Pyrus ussuriensis x Pyrus communis]|uniref:F-box/FBD/LRR-repeat protein n=1 Tax=Pyrus ussuriensis x Pyrus communis TaxID=2448454 RepID=A0A5N5I681_9ROSA|nr:F-box/FBD/LRR-repeat protein [Pyrus ussuriensis x Pyrus communis]